jgi:hypothetical protein
VGNVISLTWQAVGEQAEICFISGYPIRCQDVPVTGSQVIAIDETMLAQAIGGVGLRVTARGVFTWSIVTLDYQCLAGEMEESTYTFNERLCITLRYSPP